MKENLWDQWLHHAEAIPDQVAVVHWVDDRPTHRWTWRELLRQAEEAAGWLRSQGVGPGEVCALIIRHDPRFFPLYLGVVRLAAIPAVLAYPNNRIHPQKYVDGLLGMSRRSGLDWVLTEEALEPVVKDLVSRPGSSIRGVCLPLAQPWAGHGGQLPPWTGVDPQSPCLLQHSSGTTGLQKGVVLSHAAVLGHVEAYARAVALTPADRIVSWLPLYHDMGMIAAFHMPLAMGLTQVQMDPFQWVAAPGLLFEAIAQEKGTLAWLPNFAFNLLADRVHEEDVAHLRMDSMRLFINCSEPVRFDSHQRFLERFAAQGVRPEALSACYAMAETTFAATQTAPGRPPTVIHVDREALADGFVKVVEAGPAGRSCVSSGSPIQGVSVDALGDDGQPLSEGRVGELAIRSEWLFDGYRNKPEDTAKALRGGRYFTGDLGFALLGEWFIIGRKKDIIIVAGKNLYPEDIEDALLAVEGVLPGRAVAFGRLDPASGTEEVWVVAETAVEEEQARRTLRMAIRRAGMAIDATIAKVFLVPQRWLMKSSAGKPSRQANKQRALDEFFQEGATV
jgi:acyl-CoA synthetase (AMP-forming)/AMP-acid ligase II